MTDIKVPEGVTIEPPKQEKKNHADIRRGFEVDPTLPQIVFPHYTNNKKDTLSCILIRPDGSSHKEDNIPADPAHPVFRDIQKQFSKWELDTNTSRQIHQQEQASKNIAAMEKDVADKKQRQDLWEAKQEYLKMPCMQKPEMKVFKREVRKSQTVISAQAFAIAAILKDFDNGKEETTD